MNERIRIAIIGAGANTRERHIPGFRAIEGVEIIGVRNRTLESSQRAAAELGIPRVYGSWRELIEDKDVDAVLIGTWPNLHGAASIAALEAGKHVLCEARMAADASEARDMLAAARKRPDLIAQVVPAPMTLGVDALVQKLIADGYLGSIIAFEVYDCTGFIDSDSPLHWRQDADLSGLNVMSLGIWYEIVMRWIGEATRVTAMGRTFVKMRKDASGVMRAVKVPDHIDVCAEMACGAQGHVRVSQVIGHAHPAELSLFGTDGTLRFSQGKLYGGRRGEEMMELQVPPELEGGWRVEQDFIDSIRTDKPVTLTSFEDGAKYMEFTEAVAVSRECGRAVSLGPRRNPAG